MFYWLKDEAGKAKLRAALQALNELYPRMLAQDMLIALERNAGFLEDPDFMAAFQAEAADDQERSLAWRLHVLCWCARNALRVSGDFVECGVLRAFSSAVAMRYLDFAHEPRTWYLYDTFAGIPADQLDPGHVNPYAGAISLTPPGTESPRSRMRAWSGGACRRSSLRWSPATSRSCIWT